MSKEQMKDDIKRVTNIFKSIEKGFDAAFAAGVLSVEEEAIPMKESVEYTAGIPFEPKMERLKKANTFLPKVSHAINAFLSTRKEC